MSDIDRRKQDVDVLERVLGEVRDEVSPSEGASSLIDVDSSWFGGSVHSTVELTVGWSEESREPRDGTRARPDRDRPDQPPASGHRSRIHR